MAIKDNSAKGIFLNTLMGLPSAAKKVAKGVAGVGQDIAKGALGLGLGAAEAPTRIASDVKSLTTGQPSTIKPYQPLKVPFIGDIESPQNTAQREVLQGTSPLKATGKAGLNVALNEPLGLALKPLGLAVGAVGRTPFGKKALGAAGELARDTVGKFAPEFKNLHEDDLSELVDFTQTVGSGAEANVDNAIAVRRLAERHGINPNQTDKVLANQLSKKLKDTPELQYALKNSDTSALNAFDEQPYQTMNEPRLDLKKKSPETDHTLNTKNFNIPQVGREIIEKTVEDIKPQIQKVIGKQLSNQEAIKVAQESSNILTKTVGRESTKQWEGTMLRTRQKLADMAHSGTVDKDFIDTLKVVKSHGTDIARKLQSLSIGADPKAMGSKQAIIEAVLKVTDDTDEILKAAEGVDFTNLKQATDFYRKFIKPKSSDWLDLVRYNSMLSSPLTHIVNIASNLANTTAVAPIEKAVTGGLDFLGSAITGKDRKYFAGEGGAYAANYFKNVSEASKKFFDVMKGTRAYTNLDTSHLPVAASGIKGKVASTLGVPMRMLEGMDQFFMTLAQGGEEGALAYRALKGGKTGNIPTEAAKKSEYRLYRQGLHDEEQGIVLDAIDHITGAVQKMRNADNLLVSTVAKFTVPFLQTPMNIFKQGIEYSPLGLTTLVGAKNKTEQLSKAIIGSAVFASAATMLGSGRVTWGEPVTTDQKNSFRAAGKQPYSVKIGDKWVSYQKLPPPVAFPFAMVAAIDDAKKNKKIDDNTADMVLGGIAKYGQFLADQSYAKSIGDLLGAAKGGEAGIQKVVSNYPQQLVPFRAFGGWLARLTDEVQRKPDTAASFVDQQVQSLMMNIPGLSQKVPARLSPEGVPIKQPSPTLNAFSPVRVSQETPMAAQYDEALKIKDIKKRQTFESDQLTTRAEETIKSVETLPKEEQIRHLKSMTSSDKQLENKVKSILKDKKAGLTYLDRQIKDLHVENGERSKYIVSKVNSFKTKEEKVLYLKELTTKGLISKNVKAQIVELLKQ